MTNTSFTLKLYRIGIEDTGVGNVTKDLNLPYLLNYDFSHELDSRASFFWRNLFKLNDKEYQSFYENNLDNILDSINSTNFKLLTTDLTSYFVNYTLKLQLNNIADVASIDLRIGNYKILENDLIEIKEEGQIIFLGFVSNKEDTTKYGEFDIQKLTLVNVGKIYSLAKISADRSLADYGIKGKDVIFPDATPFQDIFNNKNTFEIINEIMTGLYKCKIENKQSKIIEYILDPQQYSNFESFNIMFPMMYLLYLYNENVYKPLYGEDFKLCRITNGKHKTYNEAVKSTMLIILPALKTTNQVIDNIVSDAMYDVFVDYNGTLNVRPPLYNFFPLEGFNPATNVKEFKPEFPYVISRDKIKTYSFIANNTEIETRSDAFFTWAYVGPQTSIPPQFFEDIPGLVKFGFRNVGPRNNPNAIAPLSARLLSMLYSHKVNNGSRSLKISVKSDLPIEKLKYEIGRLYYIDLPDLKSRDDLGTDIENLIKEKNQITNKGVMGYLVSITKSYSSGTYIVYELDFTYMRDIEIIDLETITDTTTLNKVLDDLYNIYNPYGYIEEFQDKSLRDISAEAYEQTKEGKRNEFKNLLKEGGWYNNIPIFKTMPSIIDIIELTYSDEETKKNLKEFKEKTQDETTSKDTAFYDNFLWYKSYKFKLERFFTSDIIDNKISFKEGMPIGIPTTSGNFLLNYPFSIGLNKIQQEVFNSQNKDGVNDNGESANKEIYDNFIKKLENTKIKEEIEKYKTLTNYQSYPTPIPQDGFKTFKIAYNYNQNEKPITIDNTLIYRFPTRLPLETKTGDDLTGLSQKIINRVVEMDMELFETYKTPYTPNMFFKYRTLDNNEIGTDWDTMSVKDTQDITYLTESDNWTFNYTTTTNIFDFPDGPQIQFLPIGLEIQVTKGKITQKVEVIKSYYGIQFENSTFNYIPPSENIDAFDPNKTPLQYFSPGLFFNLQTILEYNTLMTKPSSSDLKKLKKLGINENAEKQDAHKQGRAIDFMLPATSDKGLPWVYFNLLGRYKIKPHVREEFDSLLEKYFDKVIKTTAMIRIDVNKLKGLKNVEQDIREYEIDVYHIETNEKNYIDPMTEAFFSDSRRTSIKNL